MGSSFRKVINSSLGIHLFNLICLFFAPVLLAADNAYDIQTDAKVIAFADVHGAFDDWVSLLQELQIIDESLDWTGGDAHLVSLGDLIDRGPGSRQVVELLKKLQGQAIEVGGAVHLVLGNHEVMVMTGDLRYVSSAEYAAFAADESEQLRESNFDRYILEQPTEDPVLLRAKFDADFPSGYFALIQAYSPAGELGSWLLQQPFVLKVNDTVYMHGGIASLAAERSISELNETSKEELIGYLGLVSKLKEESVLPDYVGFFDQIAYINIRAEALIAEDPNQIPTWFNDFTALYEAKQSFVFSENSPIWYRGSSLCHPYAETFNTERFLKRADAVRLVVGHTPTGGQVVEREGQIIRLDTGMLKSYYGGEAAALIQEDSQIYVHYLGGDQHALPLMEQRSLSQELSLMSDAELEEYFRTAEILSSEYIGTGITKPKRVSLENNGIQQDASFKYVDSHPGIQSRNIYVSRNNDSDRYFHDVAAYKLDRLLGLQMVPVAELRTIEGDSGMLQDWVDNSINERDRLEDEVPFTGYCNQTEQYRLRFAFDILIYNEDRNLTNILWSKEDFMLRFIDHTLAFRSSTNRPRQYREVNLRISDLLRSKLLQLNEENLSDALLPYLHPRQIEAILERRDNILEDAVTTAP